MRKVLIDNLISEEILNSSGFINVDKKDVKSLIQRSTFIDGTKSIGPPSELRCMIENAFTQIESNHNQTSKRALLVIKQSTGSELNMDDVMSVPEVFSEKHDNFDFVWGLSTDSNLSFGDSKEERVKDKRVEDVSRWTDEFIERMERTLYEMEQDDKKWHSRL